MASRKLRLTTRKRLVRCYVLYTLLYMYAAETWTINKDVENQINAFEMWLFRKMLCISYQDHITNEEVLKRVQEKRTLLQTIKKRKCTFFGHVIRSDGLQRQLMEGRVEGARQRGRMRRQWTTDIVEWLGIHYGEAVRATQCRQTPKVREDTEPER